MAIRSNVGNITTNAVQIASVAATTAGGMLSDISKRLTNPDISIKEQKRYNQLKADRMMEQEEYEASPEGQELKELRRKHALEREREIENKKEETQSIDDLVTNGQQSKNLNTSINNNINIYKELSKNKSSDIGEEFRKKLVKKEK